jgi:diacylglycerol O-acyltransferase
LASVPRLRQVVYRPRWGLGRALWADAPSFDIADHVHVRPLAAPADEGELLRECERLRRRGLDRSRPLWRLWLLPGLPGGEVGMFLTAHHVLADGVAGIALLGALLDVGPEVSSAAPSPWRPRPAPSARALLGDNARRWAGALGTGLAGVLHPVRILRRGRLMVGFVRDVFRAEPAPRTSLNRPIGPDREVAVVDGALGPVKDAAHAAGGKVNDVVLAAVAGGLRDLLRARGEPVDGVEMRAIVPVSLHTGPRAQARGNADGEMLAALPVGEPDATRRLRLVAADTARRKAAVVKPAAVGGLAYAMQRLMMGWLNRQRLTNVYVANVPGPPFPLYLGGTRLLRVYPVVPLIGNIGLGIGVLSYAGQLNFTVIMDRANGVDLPVFMAGFRRSLAAYGGLHGRSGPTVSVMRLVSWD